MEWFKTINIAGEELTNQELIKELIKGEQSGFSDSFDKREFLKKMHLKASK